MRKAKVNAILKPNASKKNKWFEAKTKLIYQKITNETRRKKQRICGENQAF
jgi:hypothetical protein